MGPSPVDRKLPGGVGNEVSPMGAALDGNVRNVVNAVRNV
jgi:hypothetical protein